MRVTLAFLFISSCTSTITQQEFDEVRPQIQTFFDSFASKETPEWKIFTNPEIKNQEIFSEWRKQVGQSFGVRLKSNDLQSLLVETNKPLGSLIGEEEYAPIEDLTEDQVKENAIAAARDYGNIGDFKDFTPVSERIKNYVTGHMLSNHFVGKEYNSNFFQEVVDELMKQIPRGTPTAAKTEMLKNIHKYTDQLNTDVTDAAKRANNVFSYQRNFSVRIHRAIQIILYKSYLESGYINANNVNEMKQRVVQLIGAWRKTAHAINKDIKPHITNLLVNIPKLIEYHIDGNQHRVELLNAAEEALKADCRDCNRILV